MCKVYRLCAIESDERVKEIVTSTQATIGVLITNSITMQKKTKPSCA